MKELMMPINRQESETEIYPKEQNKSERKLDVSKLRLLNSKKTREELLKNPRYQNLEKTIETEATPINERETAQRKDDEESANAILTKIETDVA
jgi:predicted nucleotidyltransferase